MPFDHFELIAGFYDRVGQFRITAPLLGALSLSLNSLLLDAGGGTGRVATALRDRVKEVFVVDVSEGMLRRARGKGLATVCAPVELLPFLSNSIDRIIMVDALHHVMDQHHTADEIWRVLAPGGRILIIEPDIRRFLVKLIAFGEKILFMRSHFLNGEEIRSLFMESKGRVDWFVNEFNIFLVVEKDR
jgi:ubiquinone/menaquinone biosynthesis C-methylase UbiE